MVIDDLLAGDITPSDVPADQNDQGEFGPMLKRNNKQLRDDRGEVIIAQTRKKYRRQIEDLYDELDQLNVDRANMMDINPSSTQTIINPSDFDSDRFVSGDIEIGLKKRNVEIKLEVALQGYTKMFGTFKKAN